jgi:hypothetical protein
MATRLPSWTAFAASTVTAVLLPVPPLEEATVMTFMFLLVIPILGILASF